MKNLKVSVLLAFMSIIRGNIGVIVLTILILVLVATNLLFVPSLLGGLVNSANDKVKYSFVGDLVVRPAGDKDLLTNASELITQIEAVDGVAAVTFRNVISASIELDDQRIRCEVYGIDPERERQVLDIHQNMIEGNYLDGSDRDQILLGLQLAGADRPETELYDESLQKARAGDVVEATFASGVKKKFTIKGIFYTESIPTDMQAFITDEDFLKIYPQVRNQAYSLNIKLEPNANSDYVSETIGGLRGNLKVLGWTSFAGMVQSMTDSFNIIRVILNVVNVLVAGFTIFIVTYIDVSSKRRQIGIQRAIGITPVSITLNYLMRGVFYSIIGLVLAILLFMNVVMPLEAQHPFHFPLGDVYLALAQNDIVLAGIVLVGVSIVSSLIPVIGVLRIRILDAIWG
jgi:putative ABC transport system permease protein